MKITREFDKALLAAIARQGLIIKKNNEFFYMLFSEEEAYCRNCDLSVICIKTGLMQFCMTMTAFANKCTKQGYNDVAFKKITEKAAKISTCILVDMDS